MSTSLDVETGVLNIYDDRGRTYIPDNLVNKMGLEKGDKIKLVYEDGELKGKKIERDERD